jgi:hypothetical protein
LALDDAVGAMDDALADEDPVIKGLAGNQMGSGPGCGTTSTRSRSRPSIWIDRLWIEEPTFDPVSCYNDLELCLIWYCKSHLLPLKVIYLFACLWNQNVKENNLGIEHGGHQASRFIKNKYSLPTRMSCIDRSDTFFFF